MKIYCDELLQDIEVMQRETSKNLQKIKDYDNVNKQFNHQIQYNIILFNII